MQRFLSIGYGLVSLSMCVGVAAQGPFAFTKVSDFVMAGGSRFRGGDNRQVSLSSRWDLKEVDLQEALPDLRKELVFLGWNRRPDAKSRAVFLELQSSKMQYTAGFGEKIYLRRELSSLGSHFVFAAPGETSKCWIECSPMGDMIEVKVFLRDVGGRLVTHPQEHAKFTLADRHNPLQSWEIGGVRVDASFAIKQKFRYVGKDLFFCMHGGEEFAVRAQKERVDFISASGAAYSRFLTVGDLLSWDGECWQPYDEYEGERSEAPLLEVKRQDEKIMIMEIWNADGTAHQTVSLVKTPAPATNMKTLLGELQFVGMRTWTRPIMQAGSTRFILAANDWLFRDGNRWERMSSKQQLDDYVAGKIHGPLFIFEEIEKKDGEFFLRGHLFNAQHTHVEKVSLALNQEQPLGQERLGVMLAPTVDRSSQGER